MHTPSPPIYLLELFNPFSGELESADLYAQLLTALEKAYQHVPKNLPGGCRCEVSTDETTAIEGVGFFDFEHNLIACLTTNWMDHDTETPTLPVFCALVTATPSQIEEAVNKLLPK